MLKDVLCTTSMIHKLVNAIRLFILMAVISDVYNVTNYTF